MGLATWPFSIVVPLAAPATCVQGPFLGSANFGVRQTVGAVMGSFRDGETQSRAGLGSGALGGPECAGTADPELPELADVPDVIAGEGHQGALVGSAER